MAGSRTTSRSPRRSPANAAVHQRRPSQGAVYGGQAGYNWQFGRAVTGLEIDFSAADIKGSNGVTETIPFGGGTFTSSLSLSERVQYLGTARARLGWLPTDNVLLYGTAGLAWERLDLTTVQSQIGYAGPRDANRQPFARPSTSSAGSPASAPK